MRLPRGEDVSAPRIAGWRQVGDVLLGPNPVLQFSVFRLQLVVFVAPTGQPRCQLLDSQAQCLVLIGWDASVSGWVPVSSLLFRLPPPEEEEVAGNVLWPRMTRVLKIMMMKTTKIPIGAEHAQEGKHGQFDGCGSGTAHGRRPKTRERSLDARRKLLRLADRLQDRHFPRRSVEVVGNRRVAGQLLRPLVGWLRSNRRLPATLFTRPPRTVEPRGKFADLLGQPGHAAVQVGTRILLDQPVSAAERYRPRASRLREAAFKPRNGGEELLGPREGLLLGLLPAPAGPLGPAKNVIQEPGQALEFATRRIRSGRPDLRRG